MPMSENTLFRLRSGGVCRVSGIQGAGAGRRRLLEMGLVPGTEVQVLRRAPLGDPIEMSVRGYLLSIRGDQARQVAVEDVR